ncbi:HTH DNA binding protein [Erwinia phage PhiEaH1]|jgi:hypothetical protein|uniref:Uncharacterized protein n=1 Tax=Erwinia phage PhiEaH1 TaxID=1401669 RepID=W8CZW3_9CAUD|nr:HTH DNA binding protein [Erwinia phage PhiEaH1]AGX01760.1 hypothetical protein [Erwinia phage PhiEaH1]WBF04807.1 hypothetical protein [Erwinia phage vB_Ea277G]
MSKRIKNQALVEARNFFGVRLSYLLDKLAQEATMRDIAASLGIQYYAICAIRNGRYHTFSLNYLMNVAETMHLDFSVTMESKKGKTQVKATGMEKYTQVNYDLTKSKRGGLTISRVTH